MQRNLLTLIAAFCSVFFMSSCQKELSGDDLAVVPSNADSVKGNWNFILMDVKSAISYSGTMTGVTVKTLVIADFLTLNNVGTLKIDSSKLNLTDLGYSIDTITTNTAYFNGILIDSTVTDLVYDAPPLSTATEYKLIGNDSIYFPNADFINLPAELLLPPIKGLRYKLEGDKLRFYTNIITSTTDVSGGTTSTLAVNAKLNLTFQKQ